MERNEHGLTPKQEKFCQLFVQYSDKSKAYREAYDCDNMKDKTINNEAYVLTTNHYVATRITDIRKELATQNLKTKEELMNDLIDILNLTMYSEKEKSIAIKAIEVLNKMQGFNDPEKIKISQDVKIGFQGLDLEEEEEDEE